MAAIPPTMKKGYRLSSILGLSLVLPMLLFCGALLIWSYHTSRSALDQEVTNALAQKQLLAAHLIRMEFNDLERKLAAMAEDDILRILASSSSREYLRSHLVSTVSNMPTPPDLLFFGLTTTGEWVDASSPFYQTADILPMIKTMHGELRLNGRIFRLSHSQQVPMETTAMLTAAPVVHDRTGEVVGVLIGGTVLDDNLALLDSIRTETQASQCMLLSGHTPIASTSRSDSPFAVAVNSLLQDGSFLAGSVTGGRTTHLGPAIVASFEPVTLQGRITPLTLVLGAENTVFQDIQRKYLGTLGTVIVFSLGFIAFTIIAIRSLTFPPLKSLLSYAGKVSAEETDAAFAPGRIKEFNRIGLSMYEMVGKLQDSRGYIRNIIDSMPSILAGVDHNGRVTHWNLHAEETAGVPKEQALGQLITDLLPDMEGEMETILSSIQTGKPVSARKERRLPSGEHRHTDLTIYPLALPGARGAVVRIDDVTERVHIEDMVIQSEKMLSIGGLAAGMAHEINNPLAAILGNAQVMRNRLSHELRKNESIARECDTSIECIDRYVKARGVEEMLESIIEAGKRAAAIVSNMLNFSRRSDSSKLPVDMAVLLDKTVELAATDYDLKKKYDFKLIKMERRYAPDAPRGMCEPGRMQQVFLNILKNGAEAMSEKDYGSDSPRFTLRVKGEDGQVRIDIEDNGPGMSPDQQKRVFEPFFTTKEVGLGTGLGLAVSYFIVTEGQKGTMSVQSSPGKWTRFTIMLPRAAE